MKQIFDNLFNALICLTGFFVSAFTIFMLALFFLIFLVPGFIINLLIFDFAPVRHMDYYLAGAKIPIDLIIYLTPEKFQKRIKDNIKLQKEVQEEVDKRKAEQAKVSELG